MKIRFEEKMNNRYMVISPDKSGAAFSGYMYRMILENHIKGIIPCRTGNLDGKELLYYNITGLLRVSEHLREHPADEEFLKNFLRELAYVMEELQKYLIGSDSILLDPEQLFISSESGTFRFAVCFDERCAFSENLLKFSEYLIPRLPNNNYTAAAMGYDLYQNCISGQVTASVLRKIAASESVSDTADPGVLNAADEVPVTVSEEDIFILKPERKRTKKAKRKKSFRSVLSRKAAAFKEKIADYRQLWYK